MKFLGRATLDIVQKMIHAVTTLHNCVVNRENAIHFRTKM